MFLLVATQWRFTSLGQLHGLDYNALEVAARLAHIHISPDDFRRIRILEREFITLNQQKPHRHANRHANRHAR